MVCRFRGQKLRPTLERFRTETCTAQNVEAARAGPDRSIDALVDKLRGDASPRAVDSRFD
jgi:hypothetical protein